MVINSRMRTGLKCARGLTVDTHGSELRVALRDESVYDVVRDVAAQLEVPLARMEVARHRLEELFRAPAEASHG